MFKRRFSSTLEVLDDFVGLFYPEYCRGCEDSLVRGEDLICTRCLLEMPRSNYHRDVENPFYSRFRGRLPIQFVMTLFKFVKGSRVQHLLHALKYNNQPEIGIALGRIYGHDLSKERYSEKFDLILPVPLHPLKLRKRGYNQSAEFGKGLSEVLQVPCMEAMSRIIPTETQTRKSKLQRWENVSDVFKLIDKTVVRSARILLVDDVVTTGATLEACGQVLVAGGCRELSIACIAAAQ